MNSVDLDTNLVLQDFPKFELSYETMVHKKVFNAELLLAIPEGEKMFAWFTCYKNNNVCFILKLNNNRKIVEVNKIQTSFDDSLALGTIFYGTIFQQNKTSCFCIEDIYYYKGKNINTTPFLNKLNTLKHILEFELSQIALSNKHIIFGLPLIATDFNLMLKEIQLLPYKINQIKYRFTDKSNSRKILFMNYYKPGSQYSNKNESYQLTKAVFKITADIEPDIYNLFILKNGVEEYYDTAFIADYKTSVKMNQLFRKIKENDNLDAIEESDDEDEFENNDDDKFVYLDKSYNMLCEYNHKFKRWCPISLAGTGEPIVSSTLIKR
jgi:hypothetical protein